MLMLEGLIGLLVTAVFALGIDAWRQRGQRGSESWFHRRWPGSRGKRDGRENQRY